jgi:DNA-binding NarL/FixJ family response regulator
LVTYCNGSTSHLNKPIQMMLASRSKLFLEGMCKILEDETDIKIVAESLTKEEVVNDLTIIKPEFMLLDNTSLELDIHELLGLINEKSPKTRVILLSNHSEYTFAFPNLIYIDKEIGSSELLKTITIWNLASGI